MDVDNFKAVNERYGRETGDEILRCYASEILSMFRGYDMVARYDDDEFAALFPNTQKDGAIRALEKAQKRAAETYITYNGKSIPLPTFSSVLTLYTPGEKPATLLKRADQALSHAKQRGTNRVVVALPAG
jgi:diguanylate cyclase (GGDEF)-like protein